MSKKNILIVGGGVAGLSAGCYALQSGFGTTIIEHNLALGGVCTAWQRGPYTIDGCIHWLTGGPFMRLYEEVGVVPEVPLKTLETWVTYRNVRDGLEVPFTRNLDAFVGNLSSLFPKDAAELQRVREAAAHITEMKPELDAPGAVSLRERLLALWEMRGSLGSLVHFRKSIGDWGRDHIADDRLRRILTSVVPETAPAFFLLMVLGYLEQGYLSRPIGGTGAFRTALERRFRSLGGEAILHATVEEILVDANRVTGVRLTDGTMLDADIVISTSSMPETVLRLLGGRYDAPLVRDRLEKWRLFDPIALVSFGVAREYGDLPSTLYIDGIADFEVGGAKNDHLMIRVFNDDASFAPSGHTVVQSIMKTDYAWWATRGARYSAERDAVADTALDKLEPFLPEIRTHARVVDVATPLTYWAMTRSWRGAFEGWMPNSESFMSHVSKKLAGLDGLYMAGQWVEPGGGIPTAVMSGRQAVQLACADDDRAFVASESRAARP